MKIIISMIKSRQLTLKFPFLSGKLASGWQSQYKKSLICLMIFIMMLRQVGAKKREDTLTGNGKKSSCIRQSVNHATNLIRLSYDFILINNYIHPTNNYS